MANTIALVISRSADTKGRVLSAGGKAIRISVGAITRAYMSIYEVFLNPTLDDNFTLFISKNSETT